MRMTPRDRADAGRDDDQEDTETVSAEDLANLKAEAAAVARLTRPPREVLVARLTALGASYPSLARTRDVSRLSDDALVAIIEEIETILRRARG
jgi:hypothetical protein